MESLGAFLEAERGRGKTVLPAPDKYFAALKATPFERVKVVILGQDPYHGYGQANGLSFSVRKQIALPPSLRNIFKEMAVDLGQPDFQFVDGDLSGLAKQGVLLLNAVHENEIPHNSNIRVNVKIHTQPMYRMPYECNNLCKMSQSIRRMQWRSSRRCVNRKNLNDLVYDANISGTCG